jgi:4'-phosphopantetheinyl transferase
MAADTIFRHSALVTIQLFLCDVQPGAERHLPGLLARLDSAERDRAARFMFDRDRLGYAAAHTLLRHALDQTAGEQRPWRFTADAFGKPSLDPPFDSIRFNLSHADGLVSVGVDVESVLREPDEATFSSLILAPEELAELDGCADRSNRLLRIWVAKEALAKAIGLGLSLPVNQIIVRGETPHLIALPEPHGPASAWSLHSERYGAHWLALATRYGEAAPVERTAMAIEQLLNCPA